MVLTQGYPTLSKETFQEISEIFGYENVEKVSG